METTAGTYALILSSVVAGPLQIGQLGQFYVRRGFYVYIGSACGPGGVRARVSHHRKLPARPHWHIDYLRAATQLEEIWVTYDLTRWEHQWADVFKRMRGVSIPMAGFGASDCGCESHLYFFRTRPSLLVFRKRMRNSLRGHGPVYFHSTCL